MSLVINLDTLPNQQITATLDGRRYDIRVIDCGSCMAVTIVRDGVTVCDNARAVAGFPLLNYRHMEAESGNFIFTTEGDALPHYSMFGITQELIYTTNAELLDIRNG